MTLFGDVGFHFYNVRMVKRRFLASKAHEIHLNSFVTVKDLGGIFFHVLAENWEKSKGYT